jgi:hypothetical protein
VEEGGTGPFTVKVADTVSTIATDMGWEEPFIVINKIGNSEITADTPTPLKAGAGATITLQVTIPEAYTVTGFKVNNSITPVKSSADGATPAEYTFKMPKAAATISGMLTPKTPEALIGIDGVFDNTLQDLRIAQGELTPADWVNAMNLNYIRPFRSEEGGEGDGEDGGAGGPDEPPSLFDSAVTAYTSSVPFSGYPAVVAAIPSDSEAGVEVSSTQPSDNKFTVTITVTAQFWKMWPEYTHKEGDPELPEGAADNKTKTYTVAVTRGAADIDTSLSSISVMQTELTASGDGAYAGTVASNVTTLNINAAATHPNARVQVISGGAASPANLNEAGNSISRVVAAPSAGASGEITVKATAEDGTTYKDYVITIFREKDENAGPVYNAAGGIVSKREIDGTTYEIHMFIVDENTQLGGQTSSELTFTKIPAGGTVEILVVAGGGGGGKSGGSSWRAGGGGAGGFIYHPAYALGYKTSFTVKVGAGGAKATGTKYSTGGNGGDSVFGNDFTAYGGGGGGSHGDAVFNSGKSGGSGGGGSSYGGGGAATRGKAPDDGALVLGNAGGNPRSAWYSGTGGGGAKTAGADMANSNQQYSGSNGGAGTQSAISGTLSWYAGGGAGGAEDAYNQGEQYGAGQGNSGSPGTGDGGSGGGGVSSKLDGGNGGSGVVIVRWPFVSE